MKVPFSWLKEYVDIDVTPQELQSKLFSCGFEVEELIDLGAEISRVVVGVVTEAVPQEGTHLHVCKVDCGDYGHDIQISTGAPNVYVGMHTPAALDGATLPGGIKIKAKPLMGVESNGMLCSGEELGLNEDLYPGAEVYGLLDLPKDNRPRRRYRAGGGAGRLYLRHLHHRQPRRLPVGSGHRPRGGRRAEQAPQDARHRLHHQRLQRPAPVHRGGGARPLPPLPGPLCAQHHPRPVPPLDEAPPGAVRPAQHLQRGGHHQLCHAGDRPADARL